MSQAARAANIVSVPNARPRNPDTTSSGCTAPGPQPGRDTLAIARWLVHSRQCSIIPLVHGGKVPTEPWEAYQRARPTDADLVAWFGTQAPRNIGLVTGAISGLVAIDGDSPEALVWMAAHLPPTPMMAQTARGQHWFYQHPGRPVSNTAGLDTGAGHLKIDVRGDGGFVVAPGSVHPTGIIYKRLGAWPPVTDLPVFDMRWLKPEPVAPPAPPTQDNRELHHAVTGEAFLLERARRYLAKIPVPVIGQCSDVSTFRAACRLVRGFGVPPADAEDLLWDWAGHRPGWSRDWVAKKVASAARRPFGEPVGGLR